MVSSVASSPVAVVKTPSKNSYGSKSHEAIIKAVSTLTKGSSKGATRQAVSNYCKKFELISRKSDKIYNRAIREGLNKLVELGNLVVASGTTMTDFHFKLSDSTKRHVRAGEKKEANEPAKMKADKDAKVQPKKKQTPKKPATKKDSSKEAKTPKKSAPKKKDAAKSSTKKESTKQPAAKKAKKAE